MLRAEDNKFLTESGSGTGMGELLRRFPYTLHYGFDELTVTVFAVAHHRRKPGYWRPG